MNRFWGILFLLVPILGLASFLLAANNLFPLPNAWLPDNYSQSGIAIDKLFYLVHWICAFFFLGVGLLIVYCLWKFADPKRERAAYFKEHLGLELIWSIIPAAILLWLAFYQLNTWETQRVNRPMVQVGDTTVPKAPLVRVYAKQFGWEFKYAGADNTFDTIDDVSSENLMVVPSGEPIVLQLESRDVIHSFFVPQLRLKHDVVPGMTQFAWFTPTDNATMSIVCAELCGWGHYKMNATLKIVPPAEFNNWMKDQQLRIAPPEFQTRQGD